MTCPNEEKKPDIVFKLLMQQVMILYEYDLYRRHNGTCHHGPKWLFVVYDI